MPTPLSAEQAAMLESKKVEMRLANERYLRSHPELKALLAQFLINTMNKKPDHVLQYAVQFFTQDNLEENIKSMRPKPQRIG